MIPRPLIPLLIAAVLALGLHVPTRGTARAAAPNTTINSGPSGTVYTSSARFTFSSSQSNSSFQCKLDSGSWSSCTSPKTYRVSYRTHTFYVRARNSSGETDASPASRTWTAKATVTIALYCTGNPEVIRVTNANHNSSVTINTVGSIYEPRDNEPFTVNRSLGIGSSIRFESGAAADSNVLTQQYIYHNDVGTSEGARVVTSAGTVVKRCP